MTNQHYSEQFRREAVRLVTEEGYSAKKAVAACRAALEVFEEAGIDRYAAITRRSLERAQRLLDERGGGE